MKLAKALKVKNKLAGEIAQAGRLIQAANVTEGVNRPEHDVVSLYRGLNEKQQELAALKAKISRANGPIADKIFLMAELKARIVILRAIPTKDGQFTEGGRYMTEARTTTFHAAMKAAEIEVEVKRLSDQIDGLQDEVDEFNARTEI